MKQLKPLSLRHNFSWTFVGNGVYSACQWGMLVVMAKLGSPEMIGQFTLGFAITAPVIMFTNLQLRSIQATDAKQEYRFSDYLALRLIGSGLALLLIGAIVTAAGYRWQTSLVILLVSLAKVFESISDIFYGLIQQYERMDRIAFSLLIKGPLSLLFLSIGIYLSGDLLWGVTGLVFAWAAVLIGYDVRSGALLLTHTLRIQPRWRSHALLKLIWLAFPLGFVMMLISLNNNVPRYFVERFLGERELGIFAALAYVMLLGNMIVNALGDSASPRLAKYYAAGDIKAFRQLLLKLVAIAALCGGIAVLLAFVAGRQVLTFLYQSEYAGQTNVFTLLMLAAAVGYMASFLGYGMTAARYFQVQMPLFATVTGISAILCFWLIPHLGLQGAAIALLAGAIVQTVISAGVLFHASRKLQKTNK